MGRTLRLALPLVAAALLLPQSAGADQSWKTSSAAWAQANKCAAAAHKAFPDYTAEANAKREKARLDCLRSANLPAEGSSLPPTAPPSSLGR
jgi:hypothetical protein